jgi:CheY-like chemotaxis protein
MHHVSNVAEAVDIIGKQLEAEVFNIILMGTYILLLFNCHTFFLIAWCILSGAQRQLAHYADVQMPVMDGLEAIRETRRMEQERMKDSHSAAEKEEQGAFIVTFTVSTSDEEDATTAGANASIQKPFSLKSIEGLFEALSRKANS